MRQMQGQWAQLESWWPGMACHAQGAAAQQRGWNINNNYSQQQQQQPQQWVSFFFELTMFIFVYQHIVSFSLWQLSFFFHCGWLRPGNPVNSSESCEFSKELIEPIQKHMEKSLGGTGWNSKSPGLRLHPQMTVKWSSCYLQGRIVWLLRQHDYERWNHWDLVNFDILGWHTRNPPICKYNFGLWIANLKQIRRTIKNLNWKAAKDRKADHATGLGFVVVCQGFPIAFGLGQLSKTKERLGKQQNCFPLWSGVSSIVRSSWRATHLVLQHGKTFWFSSIFSSFCD